MVTTLSHHHERRGDMAQGRIACLLGPGFEDSEFRLPYDALKNAGYQVDIISMKAGTELKGYKGKETVKSEKGIDEVRADDYQAMLIPGGHSPAQIRKDKKIVEFVKKFDSMKRPIAAVCHGPQLLLTARLVRRRPLTGWEAVPGDLGHAGATVTDQGAAPGGSRPVRGDCEGPGSRGRPELDHEPQARGPEGVQRGDAEGAEADRSGETAAARLEGGVQDP